MEIILIGSGGCMRELAWQLLECTSAQKKWDIIGYIDVDKPINSYGVDVGKKIIPYLGDDRYLEDIQKPVNVVVSIGSPKGRRDIAERLKQNPFIQFPNIILGGTYICKDSDIVNGGCRGCIISIDCRISTNVKMGDFVFMNTGSMVCHDGVIGDYVTLGPDVKLAGAVKIGKDTDIGMGTKVIQGINIGSDVTVGAGSVVVNDKRNGCKIVGVPAREI